MQPQFNQGMNKLKVNIYIINEFFLYNKRGRIIQDIKQHYAKNLQLVKVARMEINVNLHMENKNYV